MVGGGNTFALLKAYREHGLLESMRQAIARGTFYIGRRTGANLAYPTIRTTNDMPIVDPGGLDALHLMPLQINPYFTNAFPIGHRCETLEQCIRELLAVDPFLEVIGPTGK